MNFQDLNKVETADKYLDIFLAAGRKAKTLGLKDAKTKVGKARRGEFERFTAIHKAAQKHFYLITKGFPAIDTLPEFYQQLIQHTIEKRQLKHSLGAVKWSMDKIAHFTTVYKEKMRKTEDVATITKYQKEAIGRICSTVKAIKKELTFLEEARRTMKAFPAIKTKLFSVTIAGFPNVGKSTLLAKLTPARPKIGNYAFTTQGINIGYETIKRHKIQFIDTPGTLNRVDKMNNIEIQAHLVLRYIADIIIYVLDLTEGYDLDKQIQLLKKMDRYDKPVIVYLSKLDVLNNEELLAETQKKYKKHQIATTISQLREIIEKEAQK